MTKARRISAASPETRARIHKRDGGRCVYCRGISQQVDHVIPRCHPSSTNDDDNLVAVCGDCNTIAGGLVFDSPQKKKNYIRAERLVRLDAVRCARCYKSFKPRVWWQQFCGKSCSSWQHIENYWKRRFKNTAKSSARLREMAKDGMVRSVRIPGKKYTAWELMPKDLTLPL